MLKCQFCKEAGVPYISVILGKKKCVTCGVSFTYSRLWYGVSHTISIVCLIPLVFIVPAFFNSIFGGFGIFIGLIVWGILVFGYEILAYGWIKKIRL